MNQISEPDTRQKTLESVRGDPLKKVTPLSLYD
jgi:hypothetical protein